MPTLVRLASPPLMPRCRELPMGVCWQSARLSLQGREQGQSRRVCLPSWQAGAMGVPQPARQLVVTLPVQCRPVGAASAAPAGSLVNQRCHQAPLLCAGSGAGLLQLRRVQQHLKRCEQRQQGVVLLNIAHCTRSEGGRGTWALSVGMHARHADKAAGDTRCRCRCCAAKHAPSLRSSALEGGRPLKRVSLPGARRPLVFRPASRSNRVVLPAKGNLWCCSSRVAEASLFCECQLYNKLYTC